MDVLNRVLLIILAIATVLFWLAAIVLVIIWPEQTLSQVLPVLREWASYFEDPTHHWQLQVIVVVLGALSGLVAFIVLILELPPASPSALTVSRRGNDAVLISQEALISRVRERVEAVEAVRHAGVRVGMQNRQLDVRAEVQTDPDVVLPPVAEEVQRAIRDTVEQGIGIPVRHIEVHFQGAGPRVHGSTRSRAAREERASSEPAHPATRSMETGAETPLLWRDEATPATTPPTVSQPATESREAPKEE